MAKECPYCGGEIQLYEEAEANIQRYVADVNARTSCCDQIVRIIPFVDYEVEEYDGSYKKDDWGR